MSHNIELGTEAVEKAWKIGDGLWCDYDEKLYVTTHIT